MERIIIAIGVYMDVIYGVYEQVKKKYTSAISWRVAKLTS